ncbi:MAG: Smr/MutS family protein [Proteobacteria bacterium]|jgi:DNA-nicking Smr family endonuclease|nr:Smr/MutS family protein [Pseudomonadota bacterium]
MNKKKTRKLSLDEKSLWSVVAGSTKPLVKEKKEPSVVEKSSVIKKRIIKLDQSLANTPRMQDPSYPYVNKANSHPESGQMDKKSFAKLKSGKVSPEATLDLHGMTASQAYPALKMFVVKSYEDNKRLLLVITGKGNKTSDSSFFESEKGVLKKNVPEWLNQSPLGQLILSTSLAHLKHGGSGALYVYLRKKRTSFS